MIERLGSVEAAIKAWPKTPRVKWAQYQNEPVTDEIFEGWVRRYPGCNWAIVTGKEINVIDADSKEAADLIESGVITRSPRSVTTSQGRHYYYQVNDIDLANAVDRNNKIDVRGRGGYVVAPGSIHASGSVYTETVLPGWGDADPSSLPTLSREDIQVLNSLKREATTSLQFVIGSDGKLKFDATKVAPGPIADEETGVPEGSRNDAAASLVGQWIKAGLDKKTILAKLHFWNRSNTPPLPDGVIELTVDSMCRTHERKNPGDVVPADLTITIAFDFDKVDPVPCFYDDIEHAVLKRSISTHLPRSIADFARDVSRRIGCDPALVVFACLAVAAVCIDDEHLIQVRQHDTQWLERVCLWIHVAR